MGAKDAIKKFGKDKSRLMDILLDIQEKEGCISDKDAETVAKELGIAKVDVIQTRSFYHFLSDKKLGNYVVYLNNSVVSGFKGCDAVAAAFENESGVKFGGNDGKIGLYYTSCIGMSDQEPAAIINGRVFGELTAAKVKDIVAAMKAGKKIDDIAPEVKLNLIQKGEVIFSDYTPGEAIKKAVSMSPEDVIKEVTASEIKGRGGAGFPAGMKWDFCRKAKGDKKYILCNADEGEPGTYKDRVILTVMPKQVFEGMALAGYAIGSDEGLLYLRNEYKYMKPALDAALEEMRKDGLLGKNAAGKDGFNFDIRVQLGAGAYVCGEESALIESAEGKRGEPRDRPPFPVEVGYMDKPTSVNNVETLSSAVKVMVKGAGWYKGFGIEKSPGTKVLSISGDCEKPGVYEIQWGMSVKEMLDMAGAKDVQAVQVGGPSGTCIGPGMFDRKLAFTDLPTGGSIIIIGKDRDLLKDVVLNFMEFFIDESCGSCVPCRALTVMYKVTLEKLIEGKAVKADIENMLKWEPYMKLNRCGLGQTAMNPIVTTIKNFRGLYDAKIKVTDDKFSPTFDLDAAVKDYDAATGNN